MLRMLKNRKRLKKRIKLMHTDKYILTPVIDNSKRIGVTAAWLINEKWLELLK